MKRLLSGRNCSTNNSMLDFHHISSLAKDIRRCVQDQTLLSMDLKTTQLEAPVIIMASHEGRLVDQVDILRVLIPRVDTIIQIVGKVVEVTAMVRIHPKDEVLHMAQVTCQGLAPGEVGVVIMERVAPIFLMVVVSTGLLVLAEAQT